MVLTVFLMNLKFYESNLKSINRYLNEIKSCIYEKMFWRVSYSRLLFNVIKIKVFHLAFVVVLFCLTKMISNLVFLSYNPICM